jgi:HEAT repeat protein
LASQSEAIFNDPAGAVRAAAYVALGELLKLRSSTALIHAIETDKNQQARKGAVMGLFLTGRQDSQAVLAVLMAMGDRNTAVGSTAVKVAKKLLSGAQPSPSITAQLRKLASDDDAAVRARSLPILGMYAGEAALDVIASTIQSDPDASVRKAAIDGLARSRLRNAGAVDAVVPALGDETAMVRGAAYRAFRNLTRQSLPFQPAADSESRARQVKAIETWWAVNRPGFETGK